MSHQLATTERRLNLHFTPLERSERKEGHALLQRNFLFNVIDLNHIEASVVLIVAATGNKLHASTDSSQISLSCNNIKRIFLSIWPFPE